MRGFTRDELRIRDATGRVYPLRTLAVKLADTAARFVGVALLLVTVGLLWEAFH